MFQHNFFGVYTFEAANILFRNNVFRDNVFYGADPHDSSVGLVFEHNEAYGNGSHGIIFSSYVNHSVVRNNYSHDNGGNGIMMDFHSDSNVIEGNVVVDNQLEGIVSGGSADLVIREQDPRFDGRHSPVAPRLRSGDHRRATTSPTCTPGSRSYSGATAATITGNRLHQRLGLRAAARTRPYSVATGNLVSDGADRLRRQNADHDRRWSTRRSPSTACA